MVGPARTSKSGVLSVNHFHGGSAGWATAIAPDEEERRRLTEEQGVPAVFVEHALDANERPRLAHFQGATLIVLRFPVVCEGTIPYRTIPLGLVLLPESVVMICAEDDPVVDRIVHFAETEWSPEARHRLLLHALEVIAEAFLGHLDAIDLRVDALEDRLGMSLENREVISLLSYQKSLARFTAALRGGEHVISQLLESSRDLRIPPEDQPLLEEALVEFRQAIESAELSGELLAQMMDAFASIISNNVNVVVKRLTAVTFVLTFPVIISSFWGMNVPLPGGHSEHALWGLLALAFAISVVIAIMLRRVRWL